MSDLSNLLGSVYGDADAAPVRREPAADERGPAWDDDARLDDAFQDWTPGPGPDAPAHEREMLDSSVPYQINESPDPDQDLAAALSAALAAETRTAPTPEQHAPPAPQAPPVPQAPPMPQAPVAAQPPMAPPVAPAPAPVHMPAPVEAAPAMPAMPKEQAFTAPMVTPSMAPAGPAAEWRFGDDDIYPMGRKAKKRG